VSGLIIAGQQAAAGRVTGDDTATALQQAMAVISSVCDYAQELDAQGFSAADAWLGHVLARMPAGMWSDPVALTAWDMLRKYRGQRQQPQTPKSWPALEHPPIGMPGRGRPRPRPAMSPISAMITAACTGPMPGGCWITR
jgi:hypothetical protein